MRALLSVVAVVALAVGSAPAEPKHREAAKLDPRLVGRWAAVQSFHGETDTTEDPPRLEYEFTADGKCITRRDGKDHEKGPRTVITDTTPDPARIDLIRDSDDPKKRMVTQGLYQVDGDTLLLRLPEPGAGRPDSLEASKYGWRVILKRAPKKDAVADQRPKDAPKPDPKLIGRWRVVRSFAGATETTDKDPGAEYEFTAEGKWVFRPEGERSFTGPGKFTTDPKANPAQIDLVLEWPDMKGRFEVWGIYTIEGDDLTVRTAEQGEARPTAFDGPGKGYRTILKRVK